MNNSGRVVSSVLLAVLLIVASIKDAQAQLKSTTTAY